MAQKLPEGVTVRKKGLTVRMHFVEVYTYGYGSSISGTEQYRVPVIRDIYKYKGVEFYIEKSGREVILMYHGVPLRMTSGRNLQEAVSLLEVRLRDNAKTPWSEIVRKSLKQVTSIDYLTLFSYGLS